MKTVVFTFARMNPPTRGHEKVVEVIFQQARQRNGEPHVYLSHSKDKKSNPLDYATKIRIAQNAFGPVVKRSGAKTIIEILKQLERKGFTDVVLVVGSDRMDEFRKLLTKYNSKEFNFDNVSVVSAGERDPDSEGIKGMSASRARELARAGERDKFEDVIPYELGDSDVSKIYNTIRKVMGTKEMKEETEEFDFGEVTEDDFSEVELDAFCEMEFLEWEEAEELDEAVLDIKQRRQRARQMKKMAPKLARKREMKKKKMADRGNLEKRAAKAATALLRKKYAGKKGQNYNALSPSEKISVDKMIEKKRSSVSKIAKRMLPKITKKEVQRVRDMRGGKKDEKK